MCVCFRVWLHFSWVEIQPKASTCNFFFLLYCFPSFYFGKVCCCCGKTVIPHRELLRGTLSLTGEEEKEEERRRKGEEERRDEEELKYSVKTCSFLNATWFLANTSTYPLTAHKTNKQLTLITNGRSFQLNFLDTLTERERKKEREKEREKEWG